MATRTFLFVDQVRSTEQLTELGDLAAQSVRRSLFHLLRRANALNGGQEVDFAGDGLFCAFDGAAAAVDAAVMMQELVASSNRRNQSDGHLEIRIGLNSGEALASEGGGYFGVAVVVGARLCASAGSGQILASGIVRSLVGPQGRHTFEPNGSFALKGVPDPVDGYSIAWAADAPRNALPALLTAALPVEHDDEGAARAPQFVGREEELQIAAQAWTSSAQGSRRLLLVTGESGMGVTRLAAEVARAHRTGAATVMAGAALGKSSRLAPWARALEEWTLAVPRADLRLAVGEDASALLRVVPTLHKLLPGLPEAGPEEEIDAIRDLAAAIDRLLSRWSDLEPVMLVLDRLDQSDPASLEILRYLMESSLPARLLIVAGYRASQVGSPAVGAALGRLTGMLNIDLHGLSREDTLRLVSAVSGETLDPASHRAIYAESGGVPARVVQLAVALRERALTRRAEDALGRVETLRSGIRTQRAEIALVVQQLEQLRYDDFDGRGTQRDDNEPSSAWAPYKGLAAYQPEDADDFYGRELLVAELVAKLASSRFLAVVGPSGSGKSSVVRAGLIPALARESVPGSSAWVPVIFTPAVESIPDALRRGRDVAHGQPIALFVDQFEELWTAGPQDSKGELAGPRAEALNLLVASVEDLDEQAVVVVSMRADYYGRTAEHPELASLMSESQVLVPPMTPGELRRAIEAPARRAGLTLEQGLVQAAIIDVGDGAGRLPLLSTAMLETWQRRQGSALTLAGYAAAGGARRAIATLAENAYAAMTDEEQEAARRIFLRLADPDDEEGDVARVATLDELGGTEATRRVLNELAARRLVTVSAMTVQVAHEALLREWPRLRGWLTTDRDGRRLHHQISSMAHDWDASGREAEALVRGARLTVASEWSSANPAELTAGEQEFLRASEAAHQTESVRRSRQVRRLQILSMGLVSLLVLASIALGFGVAQARLAGTRATEATASELSAQAGALASVNSDTSLLLAVEGYRRDPSVNTESGLLTALNGARFRTGTVTGLPKDILSLELATNGSTLYGLTSSGTIFVADLTNLTVSSRRLETGIKSPLSIVLSHSQKLLAYNGADGVTVVDAHTGARVAGPFGVSGSQGEFTFDDQSLLITSYPDPGLTIVDVRTGTAVKHDLADGSPVIATPSPTAGEFVAAPLFGNTLQRYRTDGTPIGSAVKTSMTAISALAYSPDGKKVALGGLDNNGVIVSSSTLTTSSPTFKIRGSRVYDLEFNPRSDLLAAGSDDGSVEVIDPATGVSVHRLSGLEGGVNAVFLDEHRLLVTTSTTAVEFDLDHLTAFGPSVPATPTSPSIFSVVKDPEDSTALVSAYGSVYRLTAGLAPSTRAVPTTVEGLPDVAISPDRTLLAVYDAVPGGAAKLELKRLAHVADTVSIALPKNEGWSPEIAFSPNGRYVAVRVGDGSLSVVDVARKRLLFPAKEYDGQGATTALAWSADSRSVFFGGQSGVLHFIDPRTGAVTQDLSLSPSYDLDGIARIPGTRLDAVSSESGFVYLVDTTTRKLSGQPLSAGGTQLQKVAASPDGTRIVAISRDGALRLWDTASRRAIGPAIAAHDVQAPAIVYLSNTRLITGDVLGGIVSWNLDPASWVNTACRLVGRDLTRAEWHQYLPEQPYRKTCSGR